MHKTILTLIGCLIAFGTVMTMQGNSSSSPQPHPRPPRPHVIVASGINDSADEWTPMLEKCGDLLQDVKTSNYDNIAGSDNTEDTDSNFKTIMPHNKTLVDEFGKFDDTEKNTCTTFMLIATLDCFSYFMDNGQKTPQKILKRYSAIKNNNEHEKYGLFYAAAINQCWETARSYSSSNTTDPWGTTNPQ